MEMQVRKSAGFVLNPACPLAAMLLQGFVNAWCFVKPSPLNQGFAVWADEDYIGQIPYNPKGWSKPFDGSSHHEPDVG